MVQPENYKWVSLAVGVVAPVVNALAADGPGAWALFVYGLQYDTANAVARLAGGFIGGATGGFLLGSALGWVNVRYRDRDAARRLAAQEKASGQATDGPPAGA